MGDQGDKTEEPTPHKLREAKKKWLKTAWPHVVRETMILASNFINYTMALSYVARGYVGAKRVAGELGIDLPAFIKPSKRSLRRDDELDL